MKVLGVLITIIILLANGLVALPQGLIDNPQAQERVRESLRALHSEARSLPDSSYQIDPRLNRVLERALSDTLRQGMQTNKPETLRKLLREERIIDFQVHLLSIPVDGLKAKAILKALGEIDTLHTLLTHPFINRQGIAIEIVDGKYMIHLLLTEHYIDLAELRKVTISHLPGNDIIIKVSVTGISYIENAFYRYKGETKALDLKGWGDGPYYFEIVIPEQIRSGIEFLDSTGRIIAKTIK